MLVYQYVYVHMYIKCMVYVHFFSFQDNETDSNATEGLAKVGARTALSFAFAFLKRAWRSGEDSDLCTEVLQQSLEVLQELPIPSLFNGPSVSNVWLEVVDRSMEFLKTVCLGSVYM